MTPLRRKSRRFRPLTADLEGRVSVASLLTGVSPGRSTPFMLIAAQTRTGAAFSFQASRESHGLSRTEKADPPDSGKMVLLTTDSDVSSGSSTSGLATSKSTSTPVTSTLVAAATSSVPGGITPAASSTRRASGSSAAQPQSPRAGVNTASPSARGRRLRPRHPRRPQPPARSVLCPWHHPVRARQTP